MGIHQRVKQTESGGRDVSNQRHSRGAGGAKGRNERIGGSARANSPLSSRDAGHANGAAGVRYYASARLLLRRDLDRGSSTAVRVAESLSYTSAPSPELNA